MTVLRIFVSYEPTDAAFATQLMTDLREAGAEVITDSTDPQDTTFEQFIAQELLQCQQLIVVQTLEALQSPRVGAIVDTALKYVQQGQMTGVLRVIAPTLDAEEVQAFPLTWATTPAFDASQDYPRALAKLLWNLGLIEINDISDSPLPPASHISPIASSAAQGSGEKSAVSNTFHSQNPTSLDRPVGSPRKSHMSLRSPFFLFSLTLLLILVIAGGTVFMHQSSTPVNKSDPSELLATIQTATPTTHATAQASPTPTPNANTNTDSNSYTNANADSNTHSNTDASTNSCTNVATNTYPKINTYPSCAHMHRFYLRRKGPP